MLIVWSLSDWLACILFVDSCRSLGEKVKAVHKRRWVAMKMDQKFIAVCSDAQLFGSLLLQDMECWNVVRYNPKTLVAVRLNWMWTTSRLHPWKSKQVKGTGPTNESVTWKALEQWKMTLYGTRSCKARHACIAHSNNHRTIRSLVLGFGQFYFVRMEVTWSGDPKCRANWNFRLLCWEAGSTLHPDCPKLRKSLITFESSLFDDSSIENHGIG